MGQDHYVLVIAQKSLKPLKQEIEKMGGVYNQLGYAFPFDKKGEVEALFKGFDPTQLKILLQPLGAQTFASYVRAHKADWYFKQLIEKKRELRSLEELFKISEDAAETHFEILNPSDKETLLKVQAEIEALEERVEWSRAIEDSLAQTQKTPRKVRFISELPTNYLIKEASELPRLVNYAEGHMHLPFIRKGIVAMLVGAGGVGKTHALVQLAISIATGTDWFGKYPIEKPGAVFLGLGENDEEDIHRLLRKVVKGLFSEEWSQTFFEKDPLLAAGERLSVMSFTGCDSSFISHNKPTDTYLNLLEELKQKEPEEGWSCLILDPISRFMGADAETDNAAATRFISLLERFTLELKGKPTVIFGHHMNKSGISSQGTDQAAARGSSAITDGVRWQSNLERVQKKEEDSGELNQVTFRPVKSNFTATLPSITLEKDPSGILVAREQTTILASKRKGLK